MMKKLMCICLALAMALACVGALAEGDLQAQLDAANAKIAELQSQVDTYYPYYAAQIVATYGENGIVWLDDVQAQYDALAQQYASYGIDLAQYGMEGSVKTDLVTSAVQEGVQLDKAAELGVEIVATTSFTADNKADLSTQVTQCQDAGADLVFLPIYYTEAAQILSYANKIGYAPKFFGCDGMDGILTVEGFDTSLAEGLALMTPFDANASDEATQSFVAKFKEKMDGLVPNQFAADGYDVIYALYNAMTAAGITGSESASEICTALEAQFATMTIDGLTGTGMHWDENGMISKAPAAVVIENGVYVPMG